MYKYLIIVVLIVYSFDSFSQTYWKIRNEYGDEILLTINQNVKEKSFEAFTRKDALKDIAGLFTYTLAKTAGKLNYPEIVFISGKTQNRLDSLLLTGTFNYFDKQFPFSATIFGNSFKGKYIDRNRTHLLEGVKMPGNKPINDYQSIINTAFRLTEKNILKVAWLKSDEWLDFKSKINELKPKISDDYELAACYQWLGKKLPFPAYEINKISSRDKKSQKKNDQFFRELKANTIAFEWKTLPVNAKQMDSIASIINGKGYKNLILDLRGRNSVNPISANLFLNYISKKSFIGGIYLTRKWFDANSSIPGFQEYKKQFKSFTEAEYKPNEFYQQSGRYFDVVPMPVTFGGKVYALCDSKTSKESESLVYMLKTEGLATIVGQKTAGTCMITEHLPINNAFELILPTADFYIKEGKSPEPSGIDPQIKVSGEDTMQYLLNNFCK